MAACSLLLMFLSRNQDLSALPAAFLAADSFVGASFKTSAFYLVHSIVTPMWLKPTLSEEEKAAVGRRSALVFIAAELVSFALIAYRYGQLPSAATMTVASAASAQTVTSCTTCCYAWVLRFASVVMCLHTLFMAAVVGMVAAVLARAENQDMVESVREACNARLASMPSACQVIGRVCTAVCAPAAAKAAAASSKCPFAAFASASGATCPFSGASAATVAADSASATVAPVASSSSAGACPFRTAGSLAAKAQMILTGVGSCAAAAIHKFVQGVQHAPELNASPSEQRRVSKQHRSQPQPPVGQVSSPATAAPAPSAASSAVVASSPIVDSTVASSAAPVAAAVSAPAPEPEVSASAAAAVSDPIVAADSPVVAASLPSSASSSSLSPDDDFEFVEKNEQ